MLECTEVSLHGSSLLSFVVNLYSIVMPVSFCGGRRSQMFSFFFVPTYELSTAVGICRNNRYSMQYEPLHP